MTQILPSDDLFSQGEPASEAPSMWVRVKPWTSTPPSHASGGIEVAWVWFVGASQLSSGYFSDVGPSTFGPDPTSITSRRATFATDASASGYPSPGGAMFRNATATDVQVRADFRSAFNSNAIPVGTFRGHALAIGVGARLVEGENNSDTAPDLINARWVRGYWFLRVADSSVSPFPNVVAPSGGQCVPTPGGGEICYKEGETIEYGFKYYLLRADVDAAPPGNDPVRLDESPAGEDVSWPHDWIKQGLRNSTLRMTIVTTAGDPVINCYETIGGAAERLVFTVTDSSANKITAPGRVGIMGSAEESNDSSGTELYSARMISFAEGTDLSSGDLMFRDEWERHAPSLAWDFQRDTDARKGRSLSCGWAGDAYSTRDLIVSPGTVHDIIGTDAALEQAETDQDSLPDEAAGLLAMPSQRPADSPISQNRRIDITFPTEANPPDVFRYGGIIVREGGTSYEESVWIGSAYALVIGFDVGTGDSRAEVRRYNGGTPTLLADKALALALDTQYRLEVSATNTGSGPGQIENEVVLTLSIGGVQVVLDAIVPAPPGIAVDSAGTVFDSSSERLSSAAGEGLIVDGPTNDRATLMDTWVEPTPPPPPPDPDTGDEDSIPFPTECAGKFGTLTLPLTFPVREMEPHELREAVFESDHRWASVTEHAARRAWEVTGRPVERTDGDALLAFYDSHGVEFPFDWTEPEGETVCVGFVDARMAAGLVRPEVSEYAFVLEERRD